MTTHDAGGCAPPILTADETERQADQRYLDHLREQNLTAALGCAEAALVAPLPGSAWQGSVVNWADYDIPKPCPCGYNVADIDRTPVAEPVVSCRRCRRKLGLSLWNASA